MIEKKPEDFKIPCLRNIRKLFPTTNEPFFAGFGNRMNVSSKLLCDKMPEKDSNEFYECFYLHFVDFFTHFQDVLSYRAVGIPVQRVFTINHKVRPLVSVEGNILTEGTS